MEWQKTKPRKYINFVSKQNEALKINAVTRRRRKKKETKRKSFHLKLNRIINGWPTKQRKRNIMSCCNG